MVSKLETFVSDVGGCGMFQILLSLAVELVSMVGSWGMMMMSFGSYNPGWMCDNTTGTRNMTEGDALLTSPGGLTPTTYTDNQTALKSFPHVSSESACELAKACPHIMFDPGTSTIVTEWSLFCDRAWINSLVISIQMVGVAIGSYSGGHSSDRFSRKMSMYFWVALSAVSNGVAVFSVSLPMFAVVRFFVGISVGGIMSTSLIYPLEFVTGKWRPLLTCLPTWYVGCALFGVCVWLLKDWRQAHIATAILSSIALLPAFWLPESLRWLAVHGKTEQAKSVARAMCRSNNRPPPEERHLDFKESEGSEKDKESNFCLLFHRQLLKKTVLGTCILFIVAMIFYALGFGIQSLFGNFYFNFMVYSVLPIPSSPFGGLLAHKVGRRWGVLILLACAVVLSFSVVIVFFTMHGSTKETIITGLALVSSLFAGIAWGILTAFVAELFPTSVRNTSFGFVFIGARLGGIVAPFVIPKSPDLLYVSYVCMGGLTLVCCIMVFCLPETKGQPLEDILLKTKGDEIEDGANVKEKMLA